MVIAPAQTTNRAKPALRNPPPPEPPPSPHPDFTPWPPRHVPVKQQAGAARGHRQPPRRGAAGGGRGRRRRKRRRRRRPGQDPLQRRRLPPRAAVGPAVARQLGRGEAPRRRRGADLRVAGARGGGAAAAAAAESAGRRGLRRRGPGGGVVVVAAAAAAAGAQARLRLPRVAGGAAEDVGPRFGRGRAGGARAAVEIRRRDPDRPADDGHRRPHGRRGRALGVPPRIQPARAGPAAQGVRGVPPPPPLVGEARLRRQEDRGGRAAGGRGGGGGGRGGGGGGGGGGEAAVPLRRPPLPVARPVGARDFRRRAPADRRGPGVCRRVRLRPFPLRRGRQRDPARHRRVHRPRHEPARPRQLPLRRRQGGCLRRAHPQGHRRRRREAVGCVGKALDRLTEKEAWGAGRGRRESATPVSLLLLLVL
ncbi:MAG: hypothetical protein BJ554DRAFT_3247 [Olpidium bornovanus]|uniref:Uncharacterized protein n=1 Tax=Olpidium bornovanus TaxID=278681 RepID=A0A8H7ZP30_9FUNG|nr:MAG: hypothetical protein BJ554DRAFT_3247 [Olpidium bornovanus]